MRITFLGAVREVTGSMHLIESGSDRVALDCGLFQGRRKESEEKNRTPPVKPETVTNVVLSHAHIDHSGRIPLLVKDGFKGRIFCTRATKDACHYLLLDSAHIQESDALYLNYKTLRAHLTSGKQGRGKKKVTNREVREIKALLKKGRHELRGQEIRKRLRKNRLEEIKPLYGKEDAERALEAFNGMPYREPVTVGDRMTVNFYEAGHILGSAVSMIKAANGQRPVTVCYTGDLGRFKKPILKDPCIAFAEEDRDLDLLIMESTYGDRTHDPVMGMKEQLRKVLIETFSRRGSVIIPSFAFGRTQELLYYLHELYREGGVARMPVYVDSPLASKLTRVFGEHPETYDREAHASFLERGENPFSFSELSFVGSLDESMALLEEKNPHIVISASGMCEAGRILHHLRYKIHNPRNTILVVGYMAQHTLGRRILEAGLQYEASSRRGPPPLVKFLNKEYPLAAQVKELGGFSAHADRDELMNFLQSSNLRIKKIALVHGEEDQSLALAERLKAQGYSVTVPRPGESIEIE